MDEDTKEAFGGCAMLIALLGISGAVGYWLGRTPSNRVIPEVEAVQDGFVAPSRLEVSVQDVDGNGEPETILKINSRPYLLMYNKDRQPRLLAYEVTPVTKE